MADKTVQAKVLQVALTTEQWADTTTAAKVISKGQVVVEYCTDGSTKVKIGDGVNVFANLPYITGKAVDVEWADVLNKPAFDTNLTNAGEFADAQAVGNAITAVNTIAGDAYTKANGAYDQANLAYNAANTVAENLTNALTVETYGLTLNGAVTGANTFTLEELSNGVTMETTLSNFDAAKITSGTIDIARLPHGALERCVVVADDAARFALTTADVQVGDTVKVTSTGLMYFVVDTDHLDTEAGYEVYTAGTASAVEWSGVLNKPNIDTTLTEVGNFAEAASTGNAIALAESNASGIANNAYNAANAAQGTANSAYDQANSAYDAANNAAGDAANVASDLANLANEVITVEVNGAVVATATNAKLGGTITLETTVNNISKSDVDLGAVNNSRQVDALTTVNNGNVVTWGADGHTVVDSGIAASNIVLDTDTLILNCTL